MNKEQIKALLKALDAPAGAKLCGTCGGRRVRPNLCSDCDGTGYWRADQWFTPGQIVEAARTTMEWIGLDPFSCAEANATVRAIKYFDIEDDGYAQEWSDRVFVNGPGQNERTGAKVIEQLPNVTMLVMHLFNFDSSTRWLHELMEQGPQICLLKGRVKHGRPGGSVPGGGDRPSAVLGFGTPDFRESFEPLGTVLDSLS